MSIEGFNLKGTLNAPEKHLNIPTSAKWLSGEGAGSWFYLKKEQDDYRIVRFSPNGKKECEGIFSTEAKFNLNQEYEVTYLSHCAEVNVIQNQCKIKFTLDQKQQ